VVSRILETVQNQFLPQERFWLVSTLVGETIHPGELGVLDPSDPAASIRRARETAARKLGIRPEEIVTAVALKSYEQVRSRARS
jgi:hypothetical protein